MRSTFDDLKNNLDYDEDESDIAIMDEVIPDF